MARRPLWQGMFFYEVLLLRKICSNMHWRWRDGLPLNRSRNKRSHPGVRNCLSTNHRCIVWQNAAPGRTSKQGDIAQSPNKYLGSQCSGATLRCDGPSPRPSPFSGCVASSFIRNLRLPNRCVSLSPPAHHLPSIRYSAQRGTACPSPASREGSCKAVPRIHDRHTVDVSALSVPRVDIANSPQAPHSKNFFHFYLHAPTRRSPAAVVLVRS